MVLALAGDSTITSFISRATLAPSATSAILAADATSATALPALCPDRRFLVASSAIRLPLPGAREGASARRRGLRARGGTRLEPRPLDARARPLPAPLPSFHGEVGALLVPARPHHRRLRR